MSDTASQRCALLLVSILVGCSSSHPDVTVAPPAVAASQAAAPTEIDTLPTAAPSATAAASATAAPAPTGPRPKPVLVWRGLAQPESVFVDVAKDRYLVSNVNGKPYDFDNNGFISELEPDGTVKSLKFISANEKTKLHAPKGLAVVEGLIYVADIDTVRMFDADRGAYKGAIKIAGATFLNDLTADANGKVYVADSGIKPRENDFEQTGTDAIYVIEKGKAKALVKSKELHNPNGLVVDDEGLIVCAMGAPELYRVSAKGEISDRTTVPNGMLDGFASVGSALLVSSWSASAIYRGTLGGTFAPVVENVPGPADFAFDKERGRAIVPRMLENAVEAYDLK